MLMINPLNAKRDYNIFFWVILWITCVRDGTCTGAVSLNWGCLNLNVWIASARHNFEWVKIWLVARIIPCKIKKHYLLIYKWAAMLPWLCRAAFLLHHRKLAYQTVMSAAVARSVSCTSAAVDKSNPNSGKKIEKKRIFPEGRTFDVS